VRIDRRKCMLEIMPVWNHIRTLLCIISFAQEKTSSKVLPHFVPLSANSQNVQNIEPADTE
jgi:hypothetical protein